jgi:cobalt transporter subunit CbtA
MIARLLAVGLAAGVLAGLFVSLVQMAKVTPLIHAAETYEAGAPAPHAHDGTEEPSHAHDGEAWAPADGLERTFYTWMANALTGIAYGLLLVAGFALSGRAVDWRRGILWGMAGFAAFALAPAALLPPELPGAAAAELSLRQGIWAGVALATASGIALIAFAKPAALKALGVAIIVVPLLLPGPHGEGAGLVPPELAAEFVVATLLAAALFWAFLGGVSGFLFKRFVG